MIALSVPTVLADVPSEGPSVGGTASPDRRVANSAVGTPTAHQIPEVREVQVTTGIVAFRNQTF